MKCFYKQFKFFSFLIVILFSQTATAQFRIVGYLNTWDNFPNNLSGVRFAKITHLNIAFAEPDSSGILTHFNGLSTVVNKAHQNNVKVLMSLGGADLSGTKKNWKNFTDSANVQAFCIKILNYLKSNNLDGVDIDLEGNIIGKNYGNFIKTLSLKLKPQNKLVTAAVATWFAAQIPAWSFKYFDFVNIMSYDKTGPWDPTHPGPHAPYSMAVNDINFWSNKGLPQNKMGLGLPFYGYGFGPDATVDEYAYKDIVAKYPGAQNKDKVGDTIYYNGIPTIEKKTTLAMQKASGVMIWQLTEDAPGPKSLLNAIYITSNTKKISSDDNKKAIDNAVTVFPNPAHDFLYINQTGNTPVNIQLFNASGGKVMQTQVAGSKALNISSFPAGIYMLLVITGKKSFTQKIIKI